MIINMLKSISLVIIILLSACASDHERLYQQKPAFYSYIIGDVEGNNITAEHIADVYATPASCQKTITALLAYKSLGTDYRFRTKLLGNQQDVVISFIGDPTLSSESLTKLLTPLRGQSIPGNIILDASLFKVPPHSTNIITGDIGTKFAPPISSLIIDGNIITVTAVPGKLGKKARLKNDSGYSIKSSVITEHTPTKIQLKWNNRIIDAKGIIDPDIEEKELQISPEKIDYYAIYRIKKILKTLNIKGNIKIIRNNLELPKNMKLLNYIDSEPLGEILPPALKESDNLVFDILYLTIIQAQNPQEETIQDWTQGDEIIKKLIHEYYQLDVERALFVDGSGLSRYNRIQPRQLFEILKQEYQNHEFVASMPSPGDEYSTLANRINLPEQIKAKTGTMLGITCLCGYHTDINHPQAFVIMASSFTPPTQDMQNVIDSFVNTHFSRLTRRHFP